MAGIAVNVAVLQDDKILLTQRDDMGTWILPSGGVEDGESLAQAAIRETKEETGLDVELTGLTGAYSRMGDFFPGHMVLFTARPIGGEIHCQEGETIAAEWFPFNGLPNPISPGHIRRISDAIAGKTGIAVRQEITLPGLPGKLTRQDLSEIQKTSGLTAHAFFRQFIEQLDTKETTEVG